MTSFSCITAAPSECLVIDEMKIFKMFFFCVSQEYERALKYVRILLKNEPGNKQALEMEKLINEALKKGGYVGVNFQP